jgi:transposase
MVILQKATNPQKKEKTMTTSNERTIVSLVNPICCGLDVHKESITACILFNDSEGKERTIIQEFSTFTDDLFSFRDWLLTHNCPILAMESTGVYWQPVHNILEGYIEVILVNARDIKNVPGRKTDIKDSEWLAGLLRHGLLRSSFIPSKDIREWRDLTRTRRKYVNTLSDHKKRVQKLFEKANIKIDSVVSDLFGVTGRNLMNLLVSGHTDITMKDIENCVRGKLKGKKQELYLSIKGFFTEHHRFLLELLLSTIESLENTIAALDQRIERYMSEHQELIERLKEVPGISDISARDIIAEIGTTLDAFPNEAALASWCGLCPGNNESANKRKSSKNHTWKNQLKPVMTEVAHAASRTNNTYYKEKFHRLKSRRGPKKAIIAIAHRIIKALFHIIKHGVRYKELGMDYLDKKTKTAKLYRLQKQAESFGFKLIPITVE